MREERHIVVDRFFVQEATVEDPFITTFRQVIQERYRHKYGQVTIDMDEVVPEKENQARVQFTIRKANSFVTRYYGKAALQDGQVRLDVMSN